MLMFSDSDGTLRPALCMASHDVQFSLNELSCDDIAATILEFLMSPKPAAWIVAAFFNFNWLTRHSLSESVE